MAAETPTPEAELAHLREACVAHAHLMAEVELLRVERDEANKRADVWSRNYETTRADAARLRAALEFYADPETYHAVAFAFDRPCGDFEDDFSVVEDSYYTRPMPGKTARAALSPARGGEVCECGHSISADHGDCGCRWCRCSFTQEGARARDTAAPAPPAAVEHVCEECDEDIPAKDSLHCQECHEGIVEDRERERDEAIADVATLRKEHDYWRAEAVENLRQRDAAQAERDALVRGLANTDVGAALLVRTAERDTARRVADAAQAEVAKLQAFKDYVHKRMDEAGVPSDPPGPHRDAGCRIGQRFDVLLASAAAARALLRRWVQAFDTHAASAGTGALTFFLHTDTDTRTFLAEVPHGS